MRIMRPDPALRFIFIVSILFFGATQSAVWAEDVDWPTYYPSPYGDYNRMHVTGATQLATLAPVSPALPPNVTMAEGNNTRVGIGTLTPQVFFDVRTPAAGPAAANGLHTAAFVGATGYAVGIGGINTGTAPDYGSVQAFQGTDATAAPLVLNQTGQRVGIGPNSTNAATAYALLVAGNGTIGFTQGSNRGELKVAEASGDYYPLYAPG